MAKLNNIPDSGDSSHCARSLLKSSLLTREYNRKLDLSECRRRVTYNLDSSKVYPVCHLHDKSPAEIEAIWYQTEDFSDMKDEVMMLRLKMMREGRLEETENQTGHGIKFRTADGALKEQNDRMKSVQAVLQVQTVQRGIGQSNLAAISNAYRECTRDSVNEAHQQGIQNASAALVFLLENKESDDQQLLNLVRQHHRRNRKGKNRVSGKLRDFLSRPSKAAGSRGSAASFTAATSRKAVDIATKSPACFLMSSVSTNTEKAILVPRAA